MRQIRVSRYHCRLGTEPQVRPLCRRTFFPRAVVGKSHLQTCGLIFSNKRRRRVCNHRNPKARDRPRHQVLQVAQILPDCSAEVDISSRDSRASEFYRYQMCMTMKCPCSNNRAITCSASMTTPRSASSAFYKLFQLHLKTQSDSAIDCILSSFSNNIQQFSAAISILWTRH